MANQNQTIDLSSLLAPDPSMQQSLDDLDSVSKILGSTTQEVTTKQGAVLDAQTDVVNSAQTVAQNDTQLANLLIDQQAQKDGVMAGQFDQMDQLADPVSFARNVSDYSKQLQTATKTYAKDLEESESWNPLVGIPASIRKGQSRAAAEGAAQVLQNEISGFNDIQNIRVAAYSNYQTRSTLMTKEVADAKKSNNEVRLAHTALQGQASLKTTDLEFTMTRADLNSQQQKNVIAGMNAKLTGKQIQMSTMQLALEAEMQPYRLENLKLTTSELRDNVDRRKAIEAQMVMQYPNTTLPPNWDNPSVQASMSPQVVAQLQEVIKGSSYGQNDGSFTAAVTSATASADPKATSFVVMMEEQADQANATAYAAALANDPLSASTFKPPFDKKDPLYNSKMDALARTVTSHAENVDATNLVSQGKVTLESFRALVDSGEINLAAAQQGGLLSKNASDFLANSQFDMIVAGDGAAAQVNNMFTKMQEGRGAYEKKTGIKLTSADMAQSVALWSNIALQRNNASPHTGANLNGVAIGNVSAFSSERGWTGSYNTSVKPLKLTDMNQLLARFDAISKRTATELAAAAQGPIAAPRPVTDTASPYSWMNTK